MFFPKIFNQKTKPSAEDAKRAAIYKYFLRREAEIGGSLFGPVQRGGKREFFCLDSTTWVWHEEWIDGKGQRQVRNTRYDIRPNGILKAQNGQGYNMVGLDEARNLVKAIDLYIERVKREVYAAY